jgi:parvulin-like peptidyl-prolyl isomerase
MNGTEKTVILTLSFLLASTFLFAGDKPAKAHTGKEGPVVVIGDYNMTRDKLERFWMGLPERQRRRFEKEGGRRALLETMIRRKLVVQEARELGLDADPEVRLNLEIAEDSVLYSALYRREVVGSILTEEVIRSYYEEHREGFTRPEKIRCRHILVKRAQESGAEGDEEKDAAARKEARKKIDDVMARVRGGGDFAELARQYSEDPTSAAKGGDLGFFTRDKMVKPFTDAAFALAVGETSGIVETLYGYHIIKLEARTSSSRRGPRPSFLRWKKSGPASFNP